MPQLETISVDQIQPAIFPGTELLLSVGAWGNSLTLAKGTVVAQKISDSKFYAYTQPNQVQVITLASLASGTFRLRASRADGAEVCTGTINYNGTTTDVATALNAVLGTTSCAVGGTIAALTVTFSGVNANGSYAAKAWPLIKLDLASLNAGVTGVVFDATGYDGTDRARGILSCDIVTDSSGNVYLGDTTSPSSLNPPVNAVGVYVAGTFYTADLTGMDAAGLVDLDAYTLPGGFTRIP